jgi:hypothetical protein
MNTAGQVSAGQCPPQRSGASSQPGPQLAGWRRVAWIAPHLQYAVGSSARSRDIGFRSRPNSRKHNMADKEEGVLYPASVQEPTNKQRLFLRYFTAILIDLTVLNLFVEYSEYVVIDSFTISLLAALLLQVLLKLTIAAEHRVAAYFKARKGGFAKFMRYFSAWVLLFGSKFVILEALAIAFGDKVHFGGPIHGLVMLIVVLVVMLVAEEVIVRIYRRLA